MTLTPPAAAAAAAPKKPNTGKNSKRGRHNNAPAVFIQKPKMTKDERRTKYTQIARDRKTKKIQQHRDSQLTCYHCRLVGHSVNHCPTALAVAAASASGGKKKKGSSSASTAPTTNICYKCGSTEHGLAACPEKFKRGAANDSSLPFATCFVCNEKGHLSSQCPSNEKGVYVNGGACKYCQSVRHLSVKCPTKLKPVVVKPVLEDVDVEDLLEQDPTATVTVGEKKSTAAAAGSKSTSSATNNKKKRRVVNF